MSKHRKKREETPYTTGRQVIEGSGITEEMFEEGAKLLAEDYAAYREWQLGAGPNTIRGISKILKNK